MLQTQPLLSQGSRFPDVLAPSKPTIFGEEDLGFISQAREALGFADSHVGGAGCGRGGAGEGP